MVSAVRRDVAAAFAMGLVLGAGGVFLALRATTEPAAVDEASRDADSGAPPASVSTSGRPLASAPHGTEAAPVGAAARGAETPSPAREPNDAPDAADPFAALAIVVEVTTAEGVSAGWSGTAYALPAGAPGVDDASDVPHVAVTLKAPARLPVAAPGRYDVGIVWAGGGLLRQDVAVDDGGSARASFTLPKSAPVRVVFTGPWAPGERATYDLAIELRASGSGTPKAYPGRGERIGQSIAIRATEAPQPTESDPLPVGTAFDASAEISGVTIVEFDGAGSIISSSPAQGVTPVVAPLRVAAGGELRLTLKPLTRWIVTVRTDPDPWPAPLFRARFRWETGWRDRWPSEDLDVDLSAIPRREVGPLERGAVPGTARLSWSGDGVVVGEVKVEVREGTETIESEIVVRAAPDATRTALRLDLSGVASGVQAIGWSKDPATVLVASDPHVDDSDPTLVRHWSDGGRVDPLGPEWRSVESALVATHDGRVTRPAKPPV